MDRQEPTPVINCRSFRRWLSTGLIVAGLLMLAGGGVMAYETLVVEAVPPPPLGLDENPLPVITDSALPTAEEAAYDVSTPTPVPMVLAGGPTRGAQDTLTGPPPSLTPTPIPPAADPPTRIVAPAIGLDAKIVPVGWKEIDQDGQKVSVWEVAEYAAGWHKNSALPGQVGNIVLSGHHNIKGEVFRYIVDLKPGDAVTLYADDRPYTYTVVSRFVRQGQRRAGGRAGAKRPLDRPFPRRAADAGDVLALHQQHAPGHRRRQAGFVGARPLI